MGCPAATTTTIQGIDYKSGVVGANEVLITIMRTKLYVSPHNNTKNKIVYKQ